MIPRLHVPVTAPEDVVSHLGSQEKHWKEGKSAHALASLWFKHNDFPPRVRALLETHPTFKSAELVDAFCERQVDIKSKGYPSQTDLLAVAGIGDCIAILGVEGKAGESFGVGAWNNSPGKEARLNSLCKMLGLEAKATQALRYQLLHRTASVLLEAKRYRAKDAALIVHAFGDDHDGFGDFSDFVQALGFEKPTTGKLSGPIDREGINLYAGWVGDEAPRGEGPLDYLASLRAYAARVAEDCRRVDAWCESRMKAPSDPAE
jgi:hypothetical protein